MNNKLGVALTKEICVVCCKEVDGAIVMNTVLTEHRAKKVERMHGKVVGFSDMPCKECMEAIGDGVYLIEVDESKTDDYTNPFRTGRQFGIKKEAFERIFNNSNQALKKHACFVPQEVIKQIGLNN